MMDKLKAVLAVIVITFGCPALAKAGGAPLENTCGVSADNQFSLEGSRFAKAVEAKRKGSVKSKETVSLFENSKMWVQVYTGYDYSSLGDVGTGSDGWVQYLKSFNVLTVSGGSNHSGVLAGALWGCRLDKSDSLALDLGAIFNFGNNWTATHGPLTESQNLGPTCLSASLDYILDIVKGPDSRAYITAGAGYYHAIVDYSLDDMGIISGTFTGDTIGGTLGVGEELSLGGSFGLDLSVRGRYANFSRISADSVTLGGTSLTGPWSLAIDSLNNYNILVPLSNSNIEGHSAIYHYASLDFSGIDAKVALDFYF